MKRGQVFVRAKSPSGKWGTHDVLDLDNSSYKAFLVDRLMQAGLVTSLKNVPDEEIEYHSLVEEGE